MAILSLETERELKKDFLGVCLAVAEACNQLEPKRLGLMTRQEVIKDLNISYNTLLAWERAGLRTYSPPVDNTKIIFYRTSDILKFLGVEDGTV